VTRSTAVWIEDDATAWEGRPLESLAADGELAAFRHEGFWHCVDTPRDLRHLESLCRDHPPPWHRPGAADGHRAPPARP
jgi:glucose-1-phosphate cytidylyltransferase